MILGDSLLVMTSLAEKEGLKGKVQCIYFDPPYGIKFGSNWQVSTRKRDVKDGKAEDATRQPEQVRAFRDTWKMGVHSYLAYLRDRLVVARELLTETGSVFVQIGDENVHLVRSVMDEVFGSENAFGMITFAKTGGTTGRYLACTADHLLAYAKNIDNLKYRALYRMKQVGAEGAQGYTSLELPDGARRRLTPDEMANPSSIPQGSRIFALDNLTSPRVREARTGYYPIRVGGREILPRKGEWKTHTEGMQRLVAIRRVEVVGDTPRYVRFLDDFAAFPLTNLWSDTGVAGFASDKRYVVETSSKLIERCLLMTTDPGDLVLDPLCAQAHNGSSVAQSVMWRPAELFDNRRSFVVLNAT
jgi:adenine-specific DNA-methyltransferase